jgi:hypothetical protein
VPAYVRATHAAYVSISIHQHTSAYVSARRTLPYARVGIRMLTNADVC